LIILDTNVISEPLKLHGSAAVTAWLDRQNFETLYLTANVLAELAAGVEVMPIGRRRTALELELTKFLALFGADRILPFDAEAARRYASLAARTRAAGYALPFAYGQIAAVAAVKGFSVATRDTAPFVAAGIRVIDPWKGRGG